MDTSCIHHLLNMKKHSDLLGEETRERKERKLKFCS